MPGFFLKIPRLPGLIWIIVLWALFYGWQEAFAQPVAPLPDSRVLIDVSGSMKQTDPGNLRVPALKLLINLAKDQSRFGVWSFGQQVSNLVPSGTVSGEWKKTATRAADAIHSRGLFTNIGAALEAATQGQTSPDPGWERNIVLLSDGMVDISKDPAVNAKEKARILDVLIPKLRAAGFHVHTVALSDNADQAFLKTLAMQTSGTFTLARTADDLLKAFVSTSDTVNLPEQVPLDGDQFSIDESVREFTLLVFRKSGGKATSLKAPDGQEYSQAKPSRNLNWFADTHYDLITVYNPQPGRWQVLGDLDPANRVTVVSDLEVEMQGLPDSIREGEKATMTMFLSEKGRAITNPRFLELMDITFSQETDKGEKFEGKLSQDRNGKPNIPADGIYSAMLGRTLTQGEHHFTVLVDGKTFKRKLTRTVRVVNEVLDVRTEYRDEGGQVRQFLVAQPRPDMADPEKMEVIVQIQGPKGEKSLQNATLTDGRWKIDVPPLAGLGSYEVKLKVKGTSKTGAAFETVQGPYPVDYTPLTTEESAAIQPALADRPPVTFDASAMNIPSLDVGDLPPDDLAPQPEDSALENAASPDAAEKPALEKDVLPPASAAPAETPADAEKAADDKSWLLLAGLFIAGNLAIIGLGLFFYLRFLRKTDVENTRVVSEIEELRQKQAEKTAASAASSGTSGQQAAETSASAASADIPLDLDEATVLRTSDSAAPDSGSPESASAELTPDDPAGLEVVSQESFLQEAVSQESVPQKTAAQEIAPDDLSADNEMAPQMAGPVESAPAQTQNYLSDDAPLELDDDEMVEVDDYVDYVEESAEATPAEEATGLDDLDMLLSQQEGASDTEINKTIDALLEQPTEYPGKKPADGKGKPPGFVDEEFMLDNPDTKI